MTPARSTDQLTDITYKSLTRKSHSSPQFKKPRPPGLTTENDSFCESDWTSISQRPPNSLFTVRADVHPVPSSVNTSVLNYKRDRLNQFVDDQQKTLGGKKSESTPDVAQPIKLTKWLPYFTREWELAFKGVLPSGEWKKCRKIQRISSRFFLSEGLKYELCGPLCTENILPRYVFDSFADGFPRDWAKVAAVWSDYIKKGKSPDFRWPQPISDENDDIRSICTERFLEDDYSRLTVRRDNADDSILTDVSVADDRSESPLEYLPVDSLRKFVKCMDQLNSEVKIILDRFSDSGSQSSLSSQTSLVDLIKSTHTMQTVAGKVNNILVDSFNETMAATKGKTGDKFNDENKNSTYRVENSGYSNGKTQVLCRIEDGNISENTEKDIRQQRNHFNRCNELASNTERPSQVKSFSREIVTPSLPKERNCVSEKPRGRRKSLIDNTFDICEDILPHRDEPRKNLFMPLNAPSLQKRAFLNKELSSSDWEEFTPPKKISRKQQKPFNFNKDISTETEEEIPHSTPFNKPQRFMDNSKRFSSIRRNSLNTLLPDSDGSCIGNAVAEKASNTFVRLDQEKRRSAVTRFLCTVPEVIPKPVITYEKTSDSEISEASIIIGVGRNRTGTSPTANNRSRERRLNRIVTETDCDAYKSLGVSVLPQRTGDDPMLPLQQSKDYSCNDETGRRAQMIKHCQVNIERIALHQKGGINGLADNRNLNRYSPNRCPARTSKSRQIDEVYEAVNTKNDQMLSIQQSKDCSINEKPYNHADIIKPSQVNIGSNPKIVSPRLNHNFAPRYNEIDEIRGLHQMNRMNGIADDRYFNQYSPNRRCARTSKSRQIDEVDEAVNTKNDQMLPKQQSKDYSINEETYNHAEIIKPCQINIEKHSETVSPRRNHNFVPRFNVVDEIRGSHQTNRMNGIADDRYFNQYSPNRRSARMSKSLQIDEVDEAVNTKNDQMLPMQQSRDYSINEETYNHAEIIKPCQINIERLPETVSPRLNHNFVPRYNELEEIRESHQTNEMNGIADDRYLNQYSPNRHSARISKLHQTDDVSEGENTRNLNQNGSKRCSTRTESNSSISPPFNANANTNRNSVNSRNVHREGQSGLESILKNYSALSGASSSQASLLANWKPVLKRQGNEDVILLKGDIVDQQGKITETNHISKPLQQRISNFDIITSDQHRYKLIGSICDPKHEVPDLIRCKFKHGVCKIWKYLLAHWSKGPDSKSGNYTPARVVKKESSKERPVVVIQNKSMMNPVLRKSARGRLIAPALPYWAGHRLSVYENETVVEHGISRSVRQEDVLSERKRKRLSAKERNTRLQKSLEAKSKKKQKSSNLTVVEFPSEPRNGDVKKRKLYSLNDALNSFDFTAERERPESRRTYTVDYAKGFSTGDESIGSDLSCLKM